MSKPPKTFQHCIRCDKDVTYEPIHTCTPSKRYRAGMNEGELIQQKLNADIVSDLSDRLNKCLGFIEWCSGVILYPEDYQVPPYEKAQALLRELNGE